MVRYYYNLIIAASIFHFFHFIPTDSVELSPSNLLSKLLFKDSRVLRWFSNRRCTYWILVQTRKFLALKLNKSP